MATSFDFSKNKIPAKYKQNQSSKKADVGELEYDDKRGESVAQLKLQEVANKSSSVRGLEDINNQANNSDNVTQLMSLQNTINEPQTQEETIQNQESTIQLQSSNNGVVQMVPDQRTADDDERSNRKDRHRKNDSAISKLKGDEKKRDAAGNVTEEGPTASESAWKFIQMTHDEIKKVLLDENTRNFLRDSSMGDTLNFLLNFNQDLLGSTKVDELVDLYIKGIDCQLDKLQKMQNYEEGLERIRSVSGVDSAEYKRLDKSRQRLKNTNVPFENLAQEFAKCLKLGQDKSLALWSGGKALSDYAYSRGWQPLEKTGLGMIFDDKNLVGKPNFTKLVAPLWNSISKHFCDQELKLPVHVMIRTFEGDSVLHREELPALRNKNATIKFHPVWGVGDYKTTYSEVNAEGRPDQNITGKEAGGQDSEGAATNLIMKAFTYIANQIEQRKLNNETEEPVKSYDPDQLAAADEQSNKYGTVKVKTELKKMTAEQMLKFDEDLQQQWVDATGKQEDLEKAKAKKAEKKAERKNKEISKAGLDPSKLKESTTV